MQSTVRPAGFFTDEERALIAQFRRLEELDRQIIVTLVEKYASNGSDPLPDNVIPFPQ